MVKIEIIYICTGCKNKKVGNFGNDYTGDNRVLHCSECGKIKDHTAERYELTNKTFEEDNEEV